ncbi:MAG TPA: hypothetical protein DCP31_16750, partial [Cyanobacteria bacterium UBA8543]|nr:hypothetical protein [Cyanobacteria bacterium UBA8543]
MYYGSVISSSETPTDVSKRVNLTLPDIVYDELEAWAEYQGRPVANLAAYLVESSIREAKEKGEFKTLKDRESQKSES